MKKIILLALVLILCLNLSAFAEETEAAGTIPCTIVAPNGDNEENKAILGEITADDWSVGPEDAPLTIIEYADFQCPYCSNAGLSLVKLQAAHPEEIRYIYRHFPLSFHTYAPTAAYAADAAGKQGFFFAAEEYLYGNQNAWSGLETVEAVDEWLRESFKTAIDGLDYEQWVTDYESEAIRASVDAAFEKVAATGIVGGTPTVFVNFHEYNGYYDEASMMPYVEYFKMQGNLKNECPAMIDTAADYQAVLDTDAGEIIIDLFDDETPMAVSAFVSLANDGWYNELPFHRIVPGFFLQTGDPSGLGIGNPGFTFANETNASADFSQGKGLVAMANSGADTNGSQFFITFDLAEYFRGQVAARFDDESALEEDVAARLAKMNESYTVFGKVTEETLPILDQVTGETIIHSVTIK